MQIVSEPATREVLLREWDFTLEGGILYTLTLRPEDKFESDEVEIRVFFTNGELVRIRWAKVLWSSERTRTITEVIK